VPGLGTSFGRGGATTFAADIQHSDSILIMGSNMAECHPVAFRWVMQAKTRTVNPCKLIHADPRFTRTSAMADIYAPLRAGTDIVLLGALIKRALDMHEAIRQKPAEERTAREKFFHDYLVYYTNAATLINREFRDTEDGDGLFSGFNPEKKKYDPASWRYDFPEGPGAQQVAGPGARQDPTLADNRCVFQILRKHYRRYTPEHVTEVCGTPPEVFERVAEAVLAGAGPDRSGAICYAVGWTQHTTGVQMIRAAAVLQLLLGNIGRPGGGILALRGHATIQGSTDIATLYHVHPGYLRTPDARRSHDNLRHYIDAETVKTSYWSNFPKFIVSQLKAWFGDAATAENEYGYNHLPKNIADHSHLPMFVQMSRRDELPEHDRIRGFFALGQNPAVGGQNAGFQRKALAKLDWLVVRDFFETETASFWKDSPEVRNGELRTEDIRTEVFFLPAAAVAEMSGSFTNTQRLVQWHEKAADPEGDCRSDLWFTYHLGRRLKALYANSNLARDWPIKNLRWDYLDPEENQRWRIKDEPSATLVLKEINGYQCARGQSLLEAQALASFGQLTDTGTTASGAWIYTGVYAPTRDHPRGHNHAADRHGDDWVSLGWGFSWPANRRLMYNRASADRRGRPWPKEARLAGEHRDPQRQWEGYVYWDPDRGEHGNWVGFDTPDFVLDKAPTDRGREGALGVAGLDGDAPFIMMADGKGWLFVPEGLVDGPLPTHYEPYESPVRNVLYPHQQSNPAALTWRVAGNPYAPPESREYPCVLSTYRLTEHHLSGVMSRWLPWLVELQPELFCEISTEHGRELGVGNTDWVVISTPRGSIRAKALVTQRIRPFRVQGRDGIVTVHHVGLPWHWGYKGLSTGDVVNNLSALVGDPNVTIHEAKVFVCNVRKG
jgi:formate dehydrogenase major subunit